MLTHLRGRGQQQKCTSKDAQSSHWCLPRNSSVSSWRKPVAVQVEEPMLERNQGERGCKAEVLGASVEAYNLASANHQHSNTRIHAQTLTATNNRMF